MVKVTDLQVSTPRPSPLEGEEAKTWACFSKPLVFAGEGYNKTTPHLRKPSLYERFALIKTGFRFLPLKGGGALTASSQHNRKGFTLVEMAMVLVVIGLVILIVYPALNAVRVSTQRRLTDSRLQDLLRAVAVYAQSTGCLPCPTPANTSGPGFGRVRGDTNAALCGGCAQPEGITPFASLGIPESTAHDGWGRWITMRIDPALAVNFGVVPPSALCTTADVTAGICSQAGVSQKGLCRSGLNAANRITVQTQAGASQQAAIVFVSHGPNGYGAYLASPNSTGKNGYRLRQPANALQCASDKGFENCNADGDAIFINAPLKIDNNDPFDDTLVYLDRNNIVSLLGNGSCNTVW